ECRAGHPRLQAVYRPGRRRGADGRAFPADRRESKRRVEIKAIFSLAAPLMLSKLMEPRRHPRNAVREGCASIPDRRSTSPIDALARPPWAAAAVGSRR